MRNGLQILKTRKPINMVIIGITGTLGAGKGTIVDYLKKEKGFLHFSARGFIVEEIKRRGLDVNRDTMTEVANDLRAHNSPSYIIDELYKKALTTGKNCVIESIRTLGEITSLKQKGHFYLFAVDADSKIRFDRIKARKSSTDNVDYNTFIANEKREMTSTDPNKQNLLKCIENADFVFNNNGNLNALNYQVNQILGELNI